MKYYVLRWHLNWKIVWLCNFQKGIWEAIFDIFMHYRDLTQTCQRSSFVCANPVFLNCILKNNPMFYSFPCRNSRPWSQVNKEQSGSGRNLLALWSCTLFYSILQQLLCAIFMTFQRLGELKLFVQFHSLYFLLCKCHSLQRTY